MLQEIGLTWVCTMGAAWGQSASMAGIAAVVESKGPASVGSHITTSGCDSQDKLHPIIGFSGKGYGKNNASLRGYLFTFLIAVGFTLIDVNWAPQSIWTPPKAPTTGTVPRGEPDHCAEPRQELLHS